MAWTAPKTWSVGEVATAANFNANVRDNLRYLKGLDGAVTIDNALTVSNGLNVTNSALGSTAGMTVDLDTASAATSNTMKLITRLYRYQTGSSWDSAHIQLTRYVDTTQQGIFTFGVNKFGFNIANPQALTHSYGTIGGEIFQDFDNVGGTSVTVLPLNTVAYGAQWMAVVRSTAPAVSFPGITANTQAYGELRP